MMKFCFLNNKPMAKKVLHMDNEPDTLASVKTILEKEGYQVTSVLTGKEAIQKATEGPFDLLLLDIMMPDLSGWDVFTRAMRINSKYKVIFLTVLEISPERKNQLKQHGISDYILKPFDKDDLVKRIRAAIGN